MPQYLPLLSRESYLAMFDTMSIVEIHEVKDFEKISELLNDGKPNILVSFDHLNSIEDYVLVKASITKLLDEIKNVLSIQQLGKNYEDLTKAEKMALSKDLPVIITEIRRAN